MLATQDGKLWRGEYESFEDYGQRRWGFEHSHVYRLTQWATVLRNVPPKVENGPNRETHARSLYGLPADQQRAW